MGNFVDVRKSLERQASKKFYNKFSENSSSQIVFRTDIFSKIAVGCPLYHNREVIRIYCIQSLFQPEVR